MRENWVYRRGDVYLADCGKWRGSIQGGIRPVVVMQNNTGNRHSPTLSVVKLTSKVNKKPNQPTHYMLENIRGIPYPSQVLAEQPDTINKSDIIRYMAHLSEKHMAEISRCLEVELGLDTEHEPPFSQCVRNCAHQTEKPDSV
ncbi:MAG: type II toxin-antitoxin system PemK/MazF family toxin [Clostridiales bacterium]|nr:type II toxin-antitoxin system PemK/MazF family toxin [Clostridiales bacterium]